MTLNRTSPFVKMTFKLPFSNLYNGINKVDRVIKTTVLKGRGSLIKEY